jgi:HEAT repeat protein
MRRLVLLLALVSSSSALAQFDDKHPPPDWMLRGFEAAVQDRSAIAGVLSVDSFRGLTRFVPPGPRADAMIDKLTPLLDAPDDDVRGAAALALAQTRLDERAGAVIDKIASILHQKSSTARSFAAEALGELATGDRATAAVDALLPLLADQSEEVRAATARALGKLATGAEADAVTDKLLPLLDDWGEEVKNAAAQALARTASGGRRDAVIDKLLPNFRNLGMDFFGRDEASEAIATLATGDRERARTTIEKLLKALDGWNDSRQASAALIAIAAHGYQAPVVDGLLSLLGDPEDANAASAKRPSFPGGTDRKAAIRILGAVPAGERSGAVIDKLLSFLADREEAVRGAAAEAIGKLAAGERAGPATERLLPLLNDPKEEVRASAVRGLAAIGARGADGNSLDRFLSLLNDKDNEVRIAAADALGEIPPGDRAGAVIDRLTPLLEDSNYAVRNSAAKALGRIPTGSRTAAVIDRLVPLLRDENTQDSAATALANFRATDRAEVVIRGLLPLLRNVEIDVGNTKIYRVDVAKPALLGISHAGPAGIVTAASMIGLIDVRESEAAANLRAEAHIVTGADAKKEGSELLLSWLGQPAELPVESVADDPPAANKALALIANNWAAISRNQRAREEAENAVMAAIYSACRSPGETNTVADLAHAAVAWIRDLPFEGPLRHCWSPEEKATVKKLLVDFQAVHSTHESALASHLGREQASPIGFWATWTIVGWTVAWTVFLVAFPWSRTVQSIFFWNPCARQFMSLWFVPLLLLIVPPLRRRLLAPFRSDLVAAARLEDLPKLGYFEEGRARIDGGEPTPVCELTTALRGVVVVRADSGLGKTSLLREIAAKATRPVAFLHARDCAEGVDVAISRIIRDVQEIGFVRSLVHTRALMVIVDGLNEVSADTREKIGTFARDMSKGEVIVATQPIEWRPPPNSRTVDLMPLTRDEAEAFILSRPVGSDADQPCHGDAYKAAVATLVARALDDAPSELERETAELMLSNPFDLAFAADLLAQGRVPSATALIDEAFRLADEGAPGKPGYRSIAGRPFPLEAFGRLAVVMRLEDRNWLNPDEFAAEASCLLDQKLLIARAVKGADGVIDRVLFRHDRVWDFFIAAAFSDDPDLGVAHVADTRFRGAYLRVAETWDPESARKVRDLLTLGAAESGDHSTSDEFIKRLEKRVGSKRAANARRMVRRA